MPSFQRPKGISDGQRLESSPSLNPTLEWTGPQPSLGRRAFKACCPNGEAEYATGNSALQDKAMPQSQSIRFRKQVAERASRLP